MNLKEAFRYQKFLDKLLGTAKNSITRSDHCIKVNKNHLRSAVNPEDEDIVETIEPDQQFVDNDTVIKFMELLIAEKEALSMAIGNAKKSLPEDIDAEIEANKYRQMVANAIGYMLERKPRKRQEQGVGYKFNLEGNQSTYYYKVEINEEEMFDRTEDKHIQMDLLAHADEVSSRIDSYLTNTSVSYSPPYSVNESFDDVIAEFAGIVST